MWEFFATHFWTILGVVAGLGSTALIAVVIVLGVPFLAAVAYFLGATKAVFQFLKTPLGMVLGIAALCAACLFAGDLYGTRKAVARCQEREIAAQLASTKRDLEIQTQTADDATRTATELKDAADQLEKKVQDYEAELAKRPQSSACLATDDDLRRLRGIAD